MKKLIKYIEKITLILLVVSICGFIYNIVFYEILRNRIVNGLEVPGFLDRVGIYTGLVFIIFFIFHIAAILTIILQLKIFKKESLLRSFLFFTSIVSMLMIFGDFALLSDISKEYIFGFPDEFYILYFSQFLHLIFYIFLFALITRTKRQYTIKPSEEIVVKDEAIFINAQYIGILTGTTGIFVISILSVFTEVWALRKGIIALSLIMIIPYILIVIYWLSMKLREKIVEWYDEKQYQDLTKASLVALIVSIILLVAIYAVQYIFKYNELINLIWFPIYFFFILLLFSCSILFFNKRI